MDSLKRQEQKEPIQRLRTLLASVDAPEKSPEQWDELGRGIFDALDRHSGRVLRPWRISFIIPQLSVFQISAFSASAVAVVLAIALVSFSLSRGRPLPAASVIRAQGAVEVSWVGSGRTNPDRPWNAAVASLGLTRGLVLRTPSGGAVSASGFTSSRNSAVQARATLTWPMIPSLSNRPAS